MPSTPRSRASRASSGCRMPLSRIGSEVQQRSLLEVGPAQRRVDEDAEVVADGGAEVLLRRLLQPRAEDRVGEELGDADALDERQLGALEVARLPARDEVVDGDDDRLVTGPPRPGRRSCARARRRSASRAETSAGADGVFGRSLVAAAAISSIEVSAALETTIGRPSVAAARAVARSPSAWAAVWTPIGASRTGAGIGLAEQLDREVALADVAQHPRHDPPAGERVAVGAVGVAGARGRVDVVGGGLGHRLLGGRARARPRRPADRAFAPPSPWK